MPNQADTTEFRLDTTSTTAALHARVGNPDDRAIWTWDLGRWNQDVRASASTAQSRDLAGATLASLGITDTTVLTVTATKPNTPFTGRATGHDIAKANLGSLSAALYASDKVLYSSTRNGADGTSTTMTAASANLSRMLKDGSFTIDDGNGHGVTLGDGTPVNLLPNSHARSVSATFDPRAITDYALGHDTDRQASTPLTLQVDANGNAALAPAGG